MFQQRIRMGHEADPEQQEASKERLMDPSDVWVGGLLSC